VIANQKMNTIKKWIGKKWRQFKNSRFFLAILMLAIGISYTISYYEFRKLDTDSKRVILDRSKEVGVAGVPVALASAGQGSEKNSGREEEKENVPSTLPTVQSVEKEVRKVFGNDSDVALAIFKTESALKADSKNWNCYYDGRSDICKPEDRGKAWSVDCGVAQINTLGTECPNELFDYRNNIRIAKRMFDDRGFQPWVTFNKGYYLANL